MPRLRTMTTTVLAAAALLVPAPAHAGDLPNDARCLFSFHVPPNSNNAVFELTGYAYVTSPDVPAAVGLRCEYHIGADTMTVSGALPGAAVAVADVQEHRLGVVTVCETVIVHWRDNTIDEFPTVCENP